jgi:PleD family two-component response regulator
MASTRTHRQLSVLIAHRDSVWVDQAKQRLETVGYRVTDCLEPEWAVDLLEGSRPFDLACISSELDASSQAGIMRAVKKRSVTPKVMILLDSLDSASVSLRASLTPASTGILMHRLSDDVSEFVRAVVDQLGIPLRPRP